MARNSGPNGYRAARADRLATIRQARPRPGKLATSPVLRTYVEDKLRLCWSPQQISRRLELDFPAEPFMRVCHETIYTSLFVQAKAVLPGELPGQLRTRRVRRRPHRRVKSCGPGRGRIPAMTHIADRPEHINDRAEPGHWEGDLLVGRHGRSHLVTLIERHTRYLMVLPVPDATSATVIAALTEAFTGLPEPLSRSLTCDRGIEMTRHESFTTATTIPVYFCDAYSPWQRGSNENTNGLLRQYLPKGIDISGYSQLQLNAIARQLNERPRKTLGFHTPAEMFSECVALTS